MKSNWLDFAQRIEVPAHLAEEVWHKIEQNHSEPHRAYHNLAHLETMFRALPQLTGKQELPTAVSLAVWFHDIIYDPKSQNNEGDSATLMVDRLEALVDKEVLQEAERLILLTKSHQLDDEKDDNGRILLDADLSILGAELARYRAYAQAIRYEFSHVPDELYIPGRTAVLNHFLGMAQIYLTEYGREHWEAQARQNLTWEIEDL